MLTLSSYAAGKWGLEGMAHAMQMTGPGAPQQLADAVHGAYYLMIWAVVRIFGTAELVTRLPSAVAMAVAALAA